jgi:hypothetical protein
MVLRGSRLLVGRTILKCSWDEKFASVLERLGTDELVSKIVMIISSNDRMHTVPLDAPIKLLGCHYICYYLCEETVQGTEELTLPQYYCCTAELFLR